MANFRNPDTKKEFTITNFRIIVDDISTRYIDKRTGREAEDPETKRKLEPINKKGVPFLNKSNDKETRIKMLKKRSKDHFQKEIKDKKYEMNKDLIKKFKS